MLRNILPIFSMWSLAPVSALREKKNPVLNIYISVISGAEINGKTIYSCSWIYSLTLKYDYFVEAGKHIVQCTTSYLPLLVICLAG